jgi:NitT/TauT family transport system substrate-binding protein
MFERIMKPCVVALAFLMTAAAGDASAEALKKATLIPQWTPQAQFAGYYVAMEKGMYRSHGIDLTILTGGPDSPPLDLLRDGRAQFGTTWLATALEARAGGVQLVNVAQVVQKSGLMLVARKSEGIRKPEDLNGRKVGIWDAFKVQTAAFLRKYGVAAREVPQASSVNLFLSGGVDAASAMWYNEYHTILNSGLDPEELTTFFYHEHALNFPEDGIYVMQDLLREDPWLVRDFVAASLEGWRYAFTHPEETLDIVIRYIGKANLPASRAHQRWMLHRMKDLILAGAPDISAQLKESDYQSVGKGLKDNGLIGEIPPFEAFCWR